MTCREEIDAMIEEANRDHPHFGVIISRLVRTLADRIDQLEARGTGTPP